MRKRMSIVLSAAAIALPVANGAAAAVSTTKATKKVVTKKLTGASEQADRWGTVNVTVTVRLMTVGKKTTRKFVDIGGSYSYHTDRSQYIMSQSLPILRQEVLQAQTSKVQ